MFTIYKSQREYEIKELKSKFGAETARLEAELADLKSIVNNRDDELLGERMRYSSLQKEYDKVKAKLADTNKYLSELATKEETRALRDELKQARESVQACRDELSTCEAKLIKAKMTVKEKVCFS